MTMYSCLKRILTAANLPWVVAGIVLATALAASSAWASTPIRIECIGDSITAGYTSNNMSGTPFVFNFGYRSGLYTRLTNAGYNFQLVGSSQEPWNNAFDLPDNTPSLDLRTLNQDGHRGYGGWGTADVLSNISSFLTADNPDVVLLMIGINDNGSVAARKNLNSIVQTIVNQKPNAEVIVAQITPTLTYSQSIVDYNTYIRDILVPSFQSQGKHVTTVDQYANMLTNGSIDSALFSNGINHPNAVSYDRIAETWFEGIAAVVPVPEPNTIWLLLTAGLGGLAVVTRRRKRRHT
jgi:lysophospholipase L1-like esterase